MRSFPPPCSSLLLPPARSPEHHVEHFLRPCLAPDPGRISKNHASVVLRLSACLEGSSSRADAYCRVVAGSSCMPPHPREWSRMRPMGEHCGSRGEDTWLLRPPPPFSPTQWNGPLQPCAPLRVCRFASSAGLLAPAKSCIASKNSTFPLFILTSPVNNIDDLLINNVDFNDPAAKALITLRGACTLSLTVQQMVLVSIFGG